LDETKRDGGAKEIMANLDQYKFGLRDDPNKHVVATKLIIRPWTDVDEIRLTIMENNDPSEWRALFALFGQGDPGQTVMEYLTLDWIFTQAVQKTVDLYRDYECPLDADTADEVHQEVKALSEQLGSHKAVLDKITKGEILSIEAQIEQGKFDWLVGYQAAWNNPIDALTEVCPLPGISRCQESNDGGLTWFDDADCTDCGSPWNQRCSNGGTMEKTHNPNGHGCSLITCTLGLTTCHKGNGNCGPTRCEESNDGGQTWHYDDDCRTCDRVGYQRCSNDGIMVQLDYNANGHGCSNIACTPAYGGPVAGGEPMPVQGTQLGVGTYQVEECTLVENSCTDIENCAGAVTCTGPHDSKCSQCEPGFSGDACTLPTTTTSVGTYEVEDCTWVEETRRVPTDDGTFEDKTVRVPECTTVEKSCTDIENCAGAVTCTGPDDSKCTQCEPGFSGDACTQTPAPATSHHENMGQFGSLLDRMDTYLTSKGFRRQAEE